MTTINFDLFKCRASSAHKLLAESRSNPSITEKQLEELDDLEKRDKLTERQTARVAELLVKKQNGTKIILSDTCITYLMEWYAWEMYGMVSVSKEAMYIQYCEKGKDVEGDSITILSVVDGLLYEKNEERVSNDYITGIPDVFLGDNIHNAERIIDIKSAWDYPTFLKKMHSPVLKANDLQLKCYLAITGAWEADVAHCLVNMPLRIADDLKNSLLKKMDVVSTESPEFIAAWNEIERSMYFDDIPHRLRVFKQKIEPFKESELQILYDRVKYCREWLWNFHEKYQEINTQNEIIYK